MENENDDSSSEVIHISVSRIIQKVYGNKKLDSFGLENGREIHERLGFNNQEKFKKSIKIKGKTIVIIGTPDKVDENRVYELKTTIHGREKEIVERGLAQLQLYMFITGRLWGELLIYYKDTEELILFKVVTFDRKFVENLIKKAIS